MEILEKEPPQNIYIFFSYIWVGRLARVSGRKRHLCICQTDCVYVSTYNFLYERQYACIHVCIHRCAHVCECVIQSGQRRFPLPDCVCTLSDKQHVTLNSWHSPLAERGAICVPFNFIEHNIQKLCMNALKSRTVGSIVYTHIWFPSLSPRTCSCQTATYFSAWSYFSGADWPITVSPSNRRVNWRQAKLKQIHNTEMISISVMDPGAIAAEV